MRPLLVSRRMRETAERRLRHLGVVGIEEDIAVGRLRPEGERRRCASSKRFNSVIGRMLRRHAATFSSLSHLSIHHRN